MAITVENRLEALADRVPRVVAIIGGGGKTSLLHALGVVLARRGERVVLTTTTHLARCPEAVAPETAAELEAAWRPGEPLVCGYPAPEGRMTGLEPKWYDRISAHHILVEADGSRGLPLKVHAPGEPVVPAGTGLVIQVAGLSALDRPVAQTVHRWQLAGLDPERPVDEALMAALLERGFARAAFSGPCLALVNQADDPALAERGRQVARYLTAPCLVGRLKEGARIC